MNRTISWRDSSGATHYERVTGSEDSHQLNFTDTGPVEMAVTYSTSVCNKMVTTNHYSLKMCDSVWKYNAVFFVANTGSKCSSFKTHSPTFSLGQALSDIGGGVVRW